MMSEKSQSDEENRHAASSEEACEKMGQKYGWKLKRTQRRDRPDLPVDCIFYGKQMSFWEMWHDHQDDED